jgi:small subunit ribosomal protein S11
MSEENIVKDNRPVEKKGKEIKKKYSKKKLVKKITRGRAYIQSTYNNTIVTITDLQGNAIAWESAGPQGFKGAKKATPYAAMQIVKSVVDKVKNTGISQVDVYVKGIGGGRESAIRALNTYGIEVNSIKDLTPVPHNGCRPKKVRRV